MSATQTTPTHADPSRSSSKKVYISQADVPRHTVTDALRIASSLADNFGKAPTKPLLVAQSIGLSPTSSTFRMLCGASIGYGFTDGGYNAANISLTSLGMRAVAPQEEGDDLIAMREAFLRPRIIREFLGKYNNSKLPADQIAQNVLESMGVPHDASERIFGVIRDGAQSLGLLRQIKGQVYVDLASPIALESSSRLDDSPIPAAIQMIAPRSQHYRPPTVDSYAPPSMPATGNRQIFTIPLSGKRMGEIHLPATIDKADLNRIKAWFELMEDVLIEPAQINDTTSPAPGLEVASRNANVSEDGEES